MPLNISEKVPISSSATNASPTPPPTTAPAKPNPFSEDIIFSPIFPRFIKLPVFLADNALAAKDAPI